MTLKKYNFINFYLCTFLIYILFCVTNKKIIQIEYVVRINYIRCNSYKYFPYFRLKHTITQVNLA